MLKVSFGAYCMMIGVTNFAPVLWWINVCSATFSAHGVRCYVPLLLETLKSSIWAFKFSAHLQCDFVSLLFCRMTICDNIVESCTENHLNISFSMPPCLAPCILMCFETSPLIELVVQCDFVSLLCCRMTICDSIVESMHWKTIWTFHSPCHHVWHHVFSSVLKHHPLIELVVQLNPDLYIGQQSGKRESVSFTYFTFTSFLSNCLGTSGFSAAVFPDYFFFFFNSHFTLMDGFKNEYVLWENFGWIYLVFACP
jgi:hypothetical protein